MQHEARVFDSFGDTDPRKMPSHLFWGTRLRDSALIGLMMIGTIVFLPLLIPAAIVAMSVRGRRIRRAAETFVCVVCGMPLTAQAVEWADRECQKEREELRRRHPHLIDRARERTCHAICPGCGTRYTYLQRERTFTPEKPRRQASEAT
jgi:hypothetical protein